jgi:hypothetical protein
MVVPLHVDARYPWRFVERSRGVVAAVASGRGGKGTRHLEHPRSRSCSSLATAPRESPLQPLDLAALLLFHTTPTPTRLSSQRRRKEGGP